MKRTFLYLNITTPELRRSQNRFCNGNTYPEIPGSLKFRHSWIKSICIILLMLSSINSISQSKCNVTYIANEGFLIETANKKILIDAIFSLNDGDSYVSPTIETKSKLENAISPFNNIDVIAITHQHRDHFNAAMVIKHLANDSNCLLFCPKQADLSLRKCGGYDSIKSNIEAITPLMFNDTIIKFNDIEIKVLRLEHSGPLEQRQMEHIGFLFEVNGIKIFHSGDTNPWNEEEYRALNLKDEQIDIAFLHRDFIYNSQTLAIMNKYISPKNIILMHIESSSLQKYKDKAEQIGGTIPDLHIFNKAMESKTYIFNK